MSGPGAEVGAGKIIELTDETFDHEVRNGGRCVLVDFWADWCSRCSRVRVDLEHLARDLEDGTVIATVDVDVNEEVPYRFGIRSVPTLILFREGKMIDQLVGAAPRDEILRMIRRAG